MSGNHALTTDRALRRVVRRESHSPRSAAMVVAAVIVILIAGYLAVETVLALVGADPVLIAPGAIVEQVATLPEQGSNPAIIAGAALVALVGAVLIVLAVTPGRLAKHGMVTDDSAAVLVDNGVLAASLAQRISSETGIERDRIVVGVARRTIDVTVSPEAGVSTPLDLVRDAGERELAQYRLHPAPKLVVRQGRTKGDER